MLRKSILPLLIAVALGLGAAFYAQKWFQQQAETAHAGRGQGKVVVVAAREIPFGARIEQGHLRTVSWPGKDAPEGAFEAIEDVVGKVANQRIVASEAVVRQRVGDASAGGSLAGLIDPSKRAVTVRVNDVIGVAGFLLPGNHVDVLATRMLDNRRASTRTLLENLKVLAVDQTAQPDKEKPTVVRAVTVEVDPRQAEQLVQATEEGTVQLALRNPESALPVPQVAAAAGEAPRPVARRAPEPEPITVIRQTSVGQSKE